jgi:hypothetical protein
VSANKPLLNDKPPTLILNGLQRRSLYPPGYIDYDPSKDTSDYEYDPERDYETTSSPPGCEEEPLTDLQFDFENKDPERYDFRQWYSRCQNAQVTTTVTKHGQVIEQNTSTNELGYTDAPESAADDAYALTKAGKDLCSYVGLIRGMIVDVSCPDSQAEPGAQLFRTVIQRIKEI